MKKGSCNRKCLILLLTAALAAALLAGCGSSAASQETAAVTYDTAASAEAAGGMNGAALYDAGYGEYGKEKVMEEAETSEAALQEEAAAENPQEGRKLITTMNLSAETENFDELMASVEKQVTALGGYIESSSQWNGNYGYDAVSRSRSASLTIRIPAAQLDRFITVMEESSNIVSKSKNVEDVTLAYVDLESHKKALLTEQERLLELMEKAESVEDLIAIEDKLASVRYELESMESQLRTYDNRIDYSTVYLDISEVERLTPETQQSIPGRIRTGFAENIYRVGTGIRDFLINLIINIPFIIMWLIVLAVLLFIAFRLRKVWKRKKEKRQLKRQAQQGKNAAAQQPQPGTAADAQVQTGNVVKQPERAERQEESQGEKIEN